MDIGSFFGGIGNFLGGLFGDDQKKKQQQVQQSTPQSSPLQVSSANPSSVQMPQSIQLPNQSQPQQSQPQFQAPQQLSGVTLNSQQPSQPAQPTQPKQPNSGFNLANAPSDFAKGVGGILNDFVVHPIASTLNTLGDMGAASIAGLTGDQQKVDIANQQAKKDFAGSIPGQGVDIANFLTRVPETAVAAAQSAQIANAGDPVAKQAAINQALATQKGFGNVQSFLGNMTGSGNNEAVNQAAQDISTGKGTPNDYMTAGMNSLGGATVLSGGFNALRGKFGGIAEDPQIANRAATPEQPLSLTELESRAAQEPVTATSDPASPSTRTNTAVTQSPVAEVAKAPEPAITSTNPAFQKPAVAQPATFTPPTASPVTPPELGGIPAMRTPQVEAPVAPVVTPEQQAATEVKTALDKQATTPAPETPLVQATPAELPTTKAAEQAATEQAPISPDVAVQAEKAGVKPGDTYDVAIQKIDDALDAGKITNDEHAAMDDALFKDANSRGEAIAQTAKEVPDYTSPNKNGKASVPGNSGAFYKTGDPNLDGIVHDSIIAHKGTAATADARAESLDKAGITASQRAQIRNIAVRNVDKTTGQISASGKKAIEDVIKAGDKPVTTPVSKATPKPVVETPLETASPEEAPKQAPEQTAPRPADKLFNELKSFAEDKLGKDGYGKFVDKLKRNSDTTSGNIPEALTPAEQEVFNKLSPHADSVYDMATNLKVGNQDPGLRKEYLPTKELDPTTEVTDMQSALSHGLGFLEKRANGEGHGLNSAQTQAGAEQALRDLLNTGEHLKSATPEELHPLIVDRMTNEATQGIETTKAGKPSGMHMKDDDIQAIREGNAETVRAEQAAVDAQKAADAKPGDSSLANAAKDARNKADDAAFQQQVDTVQRAKATMDNRIAEINKSSMSGAAKAAARTAAHDAFDKVDSQVHYLMSYAKSNILPTPLGRVADQSGKAVTAVEDNTFGRIGKAAANSKYTKATGGKKLFADRKTTNDVYNIVKGDKNLQYFSRGVRMNKAISVDGSKSIFGKALGAYKTGVTAAVEIGSRYRAPLKNTVSHFAAQAQHAGITDTKDIAAYVRGRANTAEWQRVYGQMYHDANPFTGVPTPRNIGGENLPTAHSRLGDAITSIKTGIANAIESTPLPKSVKANLTDAVAINVAGFPRTMFNITSAVLDRATFGAGSLIKALRMNPATDAERMTQALLIKRATTSATTLPAVGALGVTLGAAGLITGAYPTDPATRKQWQAEGKQPYSINVGGNWIDISRYAPQLAIPLQIAATIGSGAIKPDNYPQAVASIIGNTVTQVEQNFGLDQVGNVFSLLGNIASGKNTSSVEKQLSTMGAGIIAAFVPASGAANFVGQKTDSVQRDVTGSNPIESVTNNLLRRNPLTRQNLPVKTDVLGNPMGQNQSNYTKDPVEVELHRLSQNGVEAYPTGVQGVSNHYQLNDSNNKKIALTTQQQYSLDNAVKQGKEQQAKLVISSPEYQAASNKDKGAMLSKMYALDGSSIASSWASKNGVGNVKTTNSVINSKLSPEDQQALTSYKLQGSQQKTWLDDNKNRASYQTALYDNAKANGPVDSADEDLTNPKGLHYKAVAAQVDQQVNATYGLRSDYAKTTASKFKAMLNPKSTTYDPTAAQKLYDYDQARVKAGLPPKYDLAAIQASLAKTGGAGKKGSFSFAQLPSSLVGTGSTSASSGYAANAPLFKPIASLQTPTAVPIPKGRTISVKKVM